MASVESKVAIVDPDSELPRGRALIGAFVNGRRASMREAAEAHKCGERLEMRTLERPEINLRTRS